MALKLLLVEPSQLFDPTFGSAGCPGLELPPEAFDLAWYGEGCALAQEAGGALKSRMLLWLYPMCRIEDQDHCMARPPYLPALQVQLGPGLELRGAEVFSFRVENRGYATRRPDDGEWGQEHPPRHHFWALA